MVDPSVIQNLQTHTQKCLNEFCTCSKLINLQPQESSIVYYQAYSNILQTHTHVPDSSPSPDKVWTKPVQCQDKNAQFRSTFNQLSKCQDNAVASTYEQKVCM